MARSRLDVAILWHMHQPDYVDGWSGRALMPWVRLHALMSYHDTLRVVQEAPEARATFNVTPILLNQLAALAAGEVEDDFLALALPAPGELSAPDRVLLLKRFFAFNHRRRFAELPRLGELWRKRGSRGDDLTTEAAQRFSDQELLDLQVGFHLAWSGRTLREHELVTALLRKGRGYTATEKAELLNLQQEFLSRVLPAYEDAAGTDRVEISCSPFSHPILPLLCETEAAREARPGLALPETAWQLPGDAWYHILSALDEAERLLAHRPRGMWPSEGAVSQEALALIAAAGLQWTASDQDILDASHFAGAVPPGHHFRPFQPPGTNGLNLFFRDKGLSDRIGFVYANWPTERATADFVSHLQRIRAELPPGRFVVPIILDGENPWESYDQNGIPFLTALYAAVDRATGLRWTTFTEYLASGGVEMATPLDRVRAGSWINGDLTTWIGHRQKNAAWDRLSGVRSWLQERLQLDGALCQVTVPGSGQVLSAPDPAKIGPTAETELARAWRAMVAAEGSDWFWWYGDDHSTEFAQEFDELFRAHLANVYRFLDAEPDPALQRPIVSGDPQSVVHQPRFPLRVTVDGKVSSYFEWLDAGWYEPRESGVMHRTDFPVSRLYYGGDAENLFLRLDPPGEQGMAALAGLTVAVRGYPANDRVSALALPAAISDAGRMMPVAGDDSAAEGAGCFDQILEIAIPWAAFGLEPGGRCRFNLSLLRGDDLLMTLPVAGYLELRVPLGPDDGEDWLV